MGKHKKLMKFYDERVLEIHEKKLKENEKHRAARKDNKGSRKSK